MHKPNKPCGRQHGFTLVELAIVMVIIGLLIGGVLKGQELINSAKVTATVSQLKSTDAAFHTFFDKYGSLPGDMANPAARLPNCSTPPCSIEGTAGTGGVIGDGWVQSGNGQPGFFPDAGTEAAVAFVQMAAAGLMSGIAPGRGMVFGGQFPELKIGGGMWVSDAKFVVSDTELPASRHYAVLAAAPAMVSAQNGLLTAAMAAQIDRKLDDGLPLNGDVQGVGDGCTNFGAHAASVYLEGQTDNSTCTMYVRMIK